jgi:6-phosphogluconate dehydrogenase
VCEGDQTAGFSEQSENHAAIDEGVPVPVLTTALYARVASRGEADFQGKLLSAMRYGFGGHLEKSAK